MLERGPLWHGEGKNWIVVSFSLSVCFDLMLYPYAYFSFSLSVYFTLLSLLLARYTALYMMLFVATLIQYFITACTSPG